MEKEIFESAGRSSLKTIIDSPSPRSFWPLCFQAPTLTVQFLMEDIDWASAASSGAAAAAPLAGVLSAAAAAVAPSREDAARMISPVSTLMRRICASEVAPLVTILPV